MVLLFVNGIPNIHTHKAGCCPGRLGLVVPARAVPCVAVSPAAVFAPHPFSPSGDAFARSMSYEWRTAVVSLAYSDAQFTHHVGGLTSVTRCRTPKHTNPKRPQSSHHSGSSCCTPSPFHTFSVVSERGGLADLVKQRQCPLSAPHKERLRPRHVGGIRIKRRNLRNKGTEQMSASLSTHALLQSSTGRSRHQHCEQARGARNAFCCMSHNLFQYRFACLP